MEDIEIQHFRREFGVRVRQLRKARGYSQEEFAHECELHRTYMGGVERGERNISLENIYKIAQALSISLAELFIGLEKGSKQN